MQFYVAQDGQQQGPLDPELVRSRLADGTYHGSDLGWHEGAADWLPLSAIPALAPGAPPPSGPFPAQPMPAYAGQPPRTSGLAIASLILGIFSLFMTIITGIPAVICGHLSLSQIRKAQGTIAGKGMAITGLVFGYFGTFLTLFAILLGIALPVFNAVQQKGLAVRSLSEAKQLASACKNYAVDHGGEFPAQLDDLVPKYWPDKKQFTCPLGKGTRNSGYDYFGGKDDNATDHVLLSSQATTRGRQRVVVYADGHGELKRD